MTNHNFPQGTLQPVQHTDLDKEKLNFNRVEWKKNHSENDDG